MVYKEYGKRDLDIANNAKVSNFLDPNSCPLFERGWHKNKNKEHKIKHQSKIGFKTTLPKQKKIPFISNVFLA